MFEDSLVESGGKIKTKRGWATIVSFIIQGLIITIVVLIPLVVTQALPKQALQTMLVAPPPPPPPPPPAAAQAATPKAVKAESEIQDNELRMPLKIPQKIAMIKENQTPASAPPSMAGIVGGVPGGVAGGQVGGVVGGVLGSVPTAAPKLVTPTRVRVSQGVSQGLLQHKVVPEYPPVAKQAHVQGSVVLQAIIGKDGRIKNVEVVSGSPMLTSAALQAVKQWQYKPYMLNGQPTEVETQITVNFALSS